MIINVTDVSIYQQPREAYREKKYLLAGSNLCTGEMKKEQTRKGRILKQLEALHRKRNRLWSVTMFEAKHLRCILQGLQSLKHNM